MKLTFFLIAFFLVLLRVCISWGSHGRNNSNEGNFTMTGDNFIEQINWSGKIRLSDDEKSIAGISPGGYVRFRENDIKLSAESNLQGVISYTLFDGHASLSLDDSGRRFVSAVLQQMIAWGFQADDRPERIFKKGGNRALLEEIRRIKLDRTKRPYFDLLFKSDSLQTSELAEMITLIDTSGSDIDKQEILSRFTASQLRDSTLAQSWLGAVSHLGPDFEKQNLLTSFMRKGPVAGSTYDSLLSVIGHMGADFEKQDLYKKLLGDSLTTDRQWIGLISRTAGLGADFIKVDMLVAIAKKMPEGQAVKDAYLEAAKTIGGDAEYGRVMRALNK